MADIIQTLHLENDPTTNVFPNIKNENIPASAVTTIKIADGSIISTKMADQCVTTRTIDDQAVTVDKLHIERFSLGVAIGTATTYQEMEDMIVDRVTKPLSLGGALLGFARHYSNNLVPAFLHVDTTNHIIAINVMLNDGTFETHSITSSSTPTQLGDFRTFATYIRVDLLREN